MTERTHSIRIDGYTDPDHLTRRVSAVISEQLRTADPDINFLQEMDGKDYARGIANAADDGNWMESKKQQDISFSQTAKQLLGFQNQCASFVEYIGAMNVGSLKLLEIAKIDAKELQIALSQIHEDTDEALDLLLQSEKQTTTRGRRKKHTAQMVTAEAAKCYEALTGKKPKFSSDPKDHSVSGRWIDFLTAVFETLHPYVETPSIESQARKFMEKSRSEKS